MLQANPESAVLDRSDLTSVDFVVQSGSEQDKEEATDSSVPTREAMERRRSWISLLVFGAVFGALLASLIVGNIRLSPLVYSSGDKAWVAEQFAAGNNFAVFDLNVDIRGIRRAHINSWREAPQVVVLGASHWQEASSRLFPNKTFYNAHVHRDYFEDFMAVTELLLKNDKLPDTLIISIRDATFLPAEKRTDSLWLSFAPEYRAMAARLAVPGHSWVDTLPSRSWHDLLSLPALWSNALRWLQADELPGPTQWDSSETLEILSFDGSIRWSRQHKALLTPDYARNVALKAMEQRKSERLEIDPMAVEAIERLLDLLNEKGVRVVLVHPPFHPAFYNGIVDTAYGDNLRRVEAVTARLADAHDAIVVGSFDPERVGCTEAMYIDSEHSNPNCLERIVNAIPEL